MNGPVHMVPGEGVYVGMGGWDIFPFDGIFYPARRGRGFRKLEYYSRFFDSVEINSTFYNNTIPQSQVSRWLRDVSSNPRFVFTVKLFKGFSHLRLYTQQDVMRVRKMLDILAYGGKLGGLLIQFPYSFANTMANRQHLLRIGGLFPGHIRFIEVRHDSWHNPSVVNMLRENNLFPVNVDLPLIHGHMPLTRHSSEGFAYLRLMGRNAELWDHPWRLEQDGAHMVSDRYRYLYTTHELEQFALLIRGLEPKAQRTFVVFHNDPNAHSLVNGFQLRRMLRPQETLQAPLNLLRAHPILSMLKIRESDPGFSFFDRPLPSTGPSAERTL